MKAGDERAARTASQESWHSAPLTDPNAALWASITPPAHGSLQTLIRRRVASLSVDLLAQRLWLRFPGFFSSRATAQRSVLGAAFALGAGLGVAGFLAVSALTASPVSEAAANMQPMRTATAQVSAAATGARTPSQVSATRQRTADVRSSERVEANLGGGMTGASTLAASVAPAEPEQNVQALNPSDAVEEPRQTHKARHASATKRKAKARGKSRNSPSHANSNRTSNSRARMLANALGLK